jgi:transcriptional regulator with XRE-family HTH domain
MTGTELQAALREVGLSQRQFAALSGVAISTVNRWAKDKQPIPQWVAWVLTLLRRTG